MAEEWNVPKELQDHIEELSQAGEIHRGTEIPVPLDLYIERGIRQANLLRRKRLVRRLSGLSVAALLFVFVLGIRVSPAFAAAVERIPGMEYIVNFINYDKGLQRAVENDYMQKIDVSDEHDGIRLTVDGIIADKHRMVVFYSIRAEEEIDYIKLKTIQITDTSNPDRHIPSLTSYADMIEANEDNLLQGQIDMSLGMEDNVPDEVTFDATLYGRQEHWTVSFAIDQKMFAEKKLTFAIDQTIAVEGQKFTVRRAEVYPLGVGVAIEIAEDNEKHIFDFAELRLVNEKGEIYPYQMSMLGNEMSAYFESPYFAMPEHLYLEGSRLLALDKSKLEVEINLKNKQIVRAPDNQIEILEVTDLGDEIKLELALAVDEFGEHKRFYNLFKTRYRDESGAEYETVEGGMLSRVASEPYQRVEIHLPKANYNGNLIFTIADYPAFIEEPFRIRLK